MSGHTPSAPAARPLLDWGLLAALIVLWGSSFAMTKIAVAAITPHWVVALRLIVAALVLTAVLAASGRRLPRDRSSWLWFAWLGVMGNSLPFFLISWGTQFVPSAVAGILMAGVPLFVVVLAHFFLPDEPLSAGKAAGFGLGFAGVALLIGPSAFAGFGTDAVLLVAELVILSATLSYAIFGITGRRAPPMSAMVRATGSLIAAALFSTVAALALEPVEFFSAPLPPLAATFGLGLLSTAAAAVVLFRLLASAGPSFISFANYGIPAYATAIGIVFLGEDLGIATLAALALILAGVWLAERSARKTR
jgi:drug/metabolite transporter (DMT)-like permease